jgi:DNA/RNA endonuclease YhcR with UshA esterase domain
MSQPLVVKKIDSDKTTTNIMEIVKIALVIAVIGIIALFFLTQYKNESVTKVEDLKEGQVQRVEGMVNSVYVSKDNHVFLKVADSTGEIDVVAFKSANIDIAYDLVSGNQVSVLGTVQEYKNKLEIIAKEISKI